MQTKALLQGPAGSGAGNGEHGGFYGIWRFLVLDQRHFFFFCRAGDGDGQHSYSSHHCVFGCHLLSSLPLVYTTLEGRALGSCLARERRNPSSTHGRTTDTTPHQPTGRPWDGERVFLHRHLSNRLRLTWPGEEEPLSLGKDQFCETPTRLTTTPFPFVPTNDPRTIPRRHSFFNGPFSIRFWGAGCRHHGTEPRPAPTLEKPLLDGGFTLPTPYPTPPTTNWAEQRMDFFDNTIYQPHVIGHTLLLPGEDSRKVLPGRQAWNSLVVLATEPTLLLHDTHLVRTSTTIFSFLLFEPIPTGSL